MLALAAMVFVNGTVLTMDSRNTVAQAVAVKDGKILAVGANEAVRRALPDADVIDLKGQTLLPGFYAAHDHFPTSGYAGVTEADLRSPPMGAIRSIPELLAAMRKQPHGEWIIGRGYDDTLLTERRHPTRAELDTVSTTHPVWIVHTSGHLAVANSKALEIAGVTSANGLIEDRLSVVSRHIPEPTLEAKMQAVRRAAADYLAHGVTTAVIAHGTRETLITLKTAFARQFLPFRVVQMMSGPTEALPPVVAAGPVRTGAIKLIQDGSIQGYTGSFTKPYHNRPETRGWSARTRDELTAIVKRYHNAGFQIAIHGNGDAAIDDILHAYAEAQREHPRPDARHRIEHCQTAREDQLKRMKELGVTPSFFVAHVYYWGDRHRDLFLGPERAARISPLASASKLGLRYTLHNDTPVTPVDPLHLMWCAVNRLTSSGRVLGPEQRITVQQALRAVTIDAAWQNFEEQARGSIEPGKAADLVILDRNPLAVPPAEIRKIRVVRTIPAP